ncbi:MAG: radical SAM protein, partial [Clostridia bacterium]|nr:radical SAM protein [Clostridia bacterium]
AKRDLTLSEICTNASLVTDETCDEIRSLGFSPMFRVSFDGVGVHDWMRRVPGAQEQALGKLSLLKKHGFCVKVQCNVNRHTASALKKTARLLDGMGIDSIRIIQTGSSPRWATLGGEENCSYEEYYDLIFDFLRDYLSEPRNMSVIVWQTIEVLPGRHCFSLIPGDDSGEQNYSDKAPVCRSARGQMHITASGDVAPCSPMAGFFRAHGKALGNIHDTPLKKILSESSFLDTVCAPVSKIYGTDADCAACPFWKRCQGGCRALAMAQTGELTYFGKDASKCAWFKGGYEQKALSLLTEIGAKTGVEWNQI